MPRNNNKNNKKRKKGGKKRNKKSHVPKIEIVQKNENNGSEEKPINIPHNFKKGKGKMFKNQEKQIAKQRRRRGQNR